MDLKQIKRPSVPLIKLVEATGILLGVPKSTTKSKYKVPAPTNYDETVEFLSSKFYYAMNGLVTSNNITNETAFEVYSKILEPGFDYEQAVNDAGLLGRELFNLVYYILQGLQASEVRLPVQQNNVIAVVDGTRASYKALDFATHAFSHGMCNVVALSVNNVRRNNAALMKQYLYNDIKRRCIRQFKLSEHNLNVESICVDSSSQVPKRIEEVIKRTSSDVLVVGMNDCNIGIDCEDELVNWACWESPLSVVLAKGRAKARDFDKVITQRVFQICVKSADDLKSIFLKSSTLMRPRDSLIMVSIIKVRGTKADDRTSRYDRGKRSGWITGPDQLVPDFTPDYEEEFVENMRKTMEEYIKGSQLPAKIRIEKEQPYRTIAQDLCQIALEENVDVMILKSEQFRSVCVECARESPCSIAIIK
jgi:hypothetical protein